MGRRSGASEASETKRRGGSEEAKRMTKRSEAKRSKTNERILEGGFFHKK